MIYGVWQRLSCAALLNPPEFKSMSQRRLQWSLTVYDLASWHTKGNGKFEALQRPHHSIPSSKRRSSRMLRHRAAHPSPQSASNSRSANAPPTPRLRCIDTQVLHCKARYSADDGGHEPQEASTGVNTTRRLLLGRATSLMLACGCCCYLQPEAGIAAEVESFSYGDDMGRPQRWGGTCASGHRQSPVDLPKGAGSTSMSASPGQSCQGPVALAYQPCIGNDASILNTGVGTMQVNFATGLQSCSVGSMQLDMLQCHFHTPSEHAFAGQHAAMEAHLVHRNQQTGGLAVLATLMQVGLTSNTVSNPFLQAALQHAPAEPRSAVPCPVHISPKDLLPSPDASGMRHYVHYSGSLTTPPCSEDVDWVVFRDPIMVNAAQVEAFKAYVARSSTTGSNARALQPLNGRLPQGDCFNQQPLST